MTASEALLRSHTPMWNDGETHPKAISVMRVEGIEHLKIHLRMDTDQWDHSASLCSDSPGESR